MLDSGRSILRSTDIEARLRLRTYPNGKSAYFLDLRGDEWGSLGRPLLRQPGSKGWPRQGPTTRDVFTASTWARHPDYLDLISRRRRLIASGSGGQTVKEALDGYLEHLRQAKGDSHSTYRNRSSSLARHLAPIADRVLGDLDRTSVQEWIDQVRVTKGGSPSRPAQATQAALLRGLHAIWRHHMAPTSAPFRGVSVGVDKRLLEVRHAIESGRDLSRFITDGAYEPEELERLIVGARWYHEHVVASSPPLRTTTMNCWAEAIVLMATTSARLMEATRLQWHHVREDDGLIIVPGTKSAAALRALPIQDTLRPWLAHLRSAFRKHFDRDPSGTDYLIQTDPRYPRSTPAGRSLGGRIADIQRASGLKREGRSSHILRATFISTATAKGIDRDRLRHYIGHAASGGSAGREVTDRYIFLIRGLVQDIDRRIMGSIPDPVVVTERIRSFVPTERPSRGAGAERTDSRREDGSAP